MDEASSENWEDALSTFPLYLSKLSSVNCLSLPLSYQPLRRLSLLVRLVKAVKSTTHTELTATPFPATPRHAATH